MKIRFIGAVGTVTGSCTLLEHNKEFFLVDCGAGRDAVANASTPLDFKPHVLRSMFLTPAARRALARERYAHPDAHAADSFCWSAPLVFKQCATERADELAPVRASASGQQPLVRLEDYVKDMTAITHDYVLMGLVA
jgi:hypothetical protein